MDQHPNERDNRLDHVGEETAGQHDDGVARPADDNDQQQSAFSPMMHLPMQARQAGEGDSNAPISVPSSALAQAVNVIGEPLSPTAADTRRLAQKLAVHWFRGDAVHPALSIISADRGEGRTTTAINLACVYAQATVRTLLIDADYHNPMVHTLLGIEIVGVEKGVPIAVEGVPHLSVLPASHLFDGSQDRLVPSAIGHLVDSLRIHFDVILVDTPAASAGEDYLFAGLATGGGLVVTRDGLTRVKAVAKVLNSCEDAGIKIVGGTMLER